MMQWKNGYAVVALCVTVVFISLVAAFVITVVVGDVDPDVMLRFLAGPAIGNILSACAITYLTIVNRKVSIVAKQVDNVENHTNGHTTALIEENKRLTRKLEELTENSQT